MSGTEKAVGVSQAGKAEPFRLNFDSALDVSFKTGDTTPEESGAETGKLGSLAYKPGQLGKMGGLPAQSESRSPHFGIYNYNMWRNSDPWASSVISVESEHHHSTTRDRGIDLRSVWNWITEPADSVPARSDEVRTAPRDEDYKAGYKRAKRAYRRGKVTDPKGMRELRTAQCKAGNNVSCGVATVHYDVAQTRGTNISFARGLGTVLVAGAIIGFVALASD